MNENKRKITLNSTLGFIGNASLVFSILSSIARMDSLRDMLDYIASIGTELQLIITKIVLPWRIMTNYLLHKLPVDLPDYAIDTGVLTLGGLLAVQAALYNKYVSKTYKKAYSHFIDNIIPIFIRETSRVTYEAQCDEIAEAMQFKNYLLIFHVLDGPPLEFLRYRLEGNSITEIRRLHESSKEYLLKLPESFKLIENYRNKFIKRQKKLSIILLSFTFLLIIEKYINSGEIVLFDYLLYAVIIAVLWLSLSILLFMGKYLVVYLSAMFYRDKKKRVAFINSAVDRLSKVMLPSLFKDYKHKIENLMPENYMVYKGQKRERKYFSDLILEDHS